MLSLEFKKLEFKSSDYWKTVALRELLLRKPLGLKFNTEDLFEEKNMHHLALFDKETFCVACLILVPETQHLIKMRQVAVAEKMQGSGIGKYLVEKSEKWAQNQGYKEMYCHARETATPFYLKLGYQKEGDLFNEVGIPHYKMTKSLVQKR